MSKSTSKKATVTVTEEEKATMKARLMQEIENTDDFNVLASCSFIVGDRCLSKDGDKRAYLIRILLLHVLDNDSLDDLTLLTSLAVNFNGVGKEVAVSE